MTGRYLSVGVSVEYWRASWQLESSEKLRMVMSGAGPTLRAPQPPATLRADSQQTVDVVDTYSDVVTLHWRLSFPFHTLFYSQKTKEVLKCILDYVFWLREQPYKA